MTNPLASKKDCSASGGIHPTSTLRFPTASCGDGKTAAMDADLWDRLPHRLTGAARTRWREWTPRRRAIVLAALAVGLAFATLVAWASWRLPLDRALAPLPDPTLVLLDADGEPFARRGAYKEAPVKVGELPEHVVEAVLAIEDRRFYHHAGLDPRGIARALWHDLHAGAAEQGGSTVTQQLAKTAFLSPERSWRRKVQEAAIAVWLEVRLDKDEILSRYLSSIYFGDGTYGLRAAARHYFDVAPEELDLGQAAMLAGLVKAPSRLAPTHDLAAAQARARVVLDAMVDAEAITREEADAARPAQLHLGRDDLPVGGWFADWVAPQAKAAFDAEYGEVAVRTTLDARLQRTAERLLERTLARAGRGGPTQAALVAMTSEGEVVALVGGRDYEASPFDRATQARRQPGSAFKLFVYLAALRAGLTPDSLVDDAPVTVGDWTPVNHDGRYEGPIPLRRAFAQSSNVAAVRLAQEVGPEAVADAARDLGLSGPFGHDATLALGTYETSLLELTAAYAAVAAGVAPVVPHGLAGAQPDGDREPLPETDALRDLLAAVTEDGTGRAARLRLPTYGKTGTTQDNRDAWFVGYSGDLVAGVWVGNDDGAPMDGVSGGGIPARLWRDFMLAAVPGQGMPVEAAPRQSSGGFWRRIFGGGWGGRSERGRGHGNGGKAGKRKKHGR
jgi:penicillin-binding protein 1A